MFGAFFSGDLYFGKSIWGPIAPIRTNPDIDGSLVQSYTPVGTLEPTTYDTGAYTRTYGTQAGFTAIDSETPGSFTRTVAPQGTIERLK